jgi:hypothetical protein
MQLEEEKYANRIVEAFCDGTLMLPENSTASTLRAFLAEKLVSLYNFGAMWKADVVMRRSAIPCASQRSMPA